MNASLHPQKLLVIGTALLGMLATFLPWIELPIVGTLNGTSGKPLISNLGWATFFCFGLCIFFATKGMSQEGIEEKYRPVFFILLIINIMIGTYKILDIMDRMKLIEQDEDKLFRAFSSTVSVGIGLYLIVVSSLAIVFLSLRHTLQRIYNKQSHLL